MKGVAGVVDIKQYTYWVSQNKLHLYISKKEKEMNDILLKLYLGDSNRQPKPSR